VIGSPHSNLEHQICMTDKSLDERIPRLEQSIKQNPHSSTNDREQLEELKKQRDKEAAEVKW